MPGSELPSGCADSGHGPGSSETLDINQVPPGTYYLVVDAADPSWGAFSVSVPGVYVETVKRAERVDDLIVRLYEGWGRQVRARLSSGRRRLSCPSP